MSVIGPGFSLAEPVLTVHRPCAGIAVAPPVTNAYLQLSWNDCDAAGNPIDPFWVEPVASAKTQTPQPRQQPPATSGKECGSFPYVHDKVELKEGCVSADVWTSVPRGGLHELSCRRLRYLPDIFKIFFPDRDLYGHLNFGLFSLTGKVRFEEKASPDQDYNFALLADGPTLPMTIDNKQTDDKKPYIELEFFGPESADLFQSPWWSELRERVRDGRDENPNWQSTKDFVGTADASAFGLLGLDCEHGCATELHPLYALALRSHPPAEAPGDRWVFFARNSGSEGWCSDGRQIDLGLQHLALVLKPPGGTAAGLDLIRFKVLKHPSDATVEWILLPASNGAVLLVTFSPTDSRSQLLEGDLVLKWR